MAKINISSTENSIINNNPVMSLRVSLRIMCTLGTPPSRNWVVEHYGRIT